MHEKTDKFVEIIKIDGKVLYWLRLCNGYKYN